MNKGKTIFFVLLGATALAGVYYFIRRQRLAKDKEQDMAGTGVSIPTSSSVFTPAPTPTPTKNDDFPLSKGSQGKNVIRLQQALIKAFGKECLPKFGADGIWGSETENCLKSHNLPTTIRLKDIVDIENMPIASKYGNVLPTQTYYQTSPTGNPYVTTKF